MTFDSTLAGVNNGQFAGSGFQPAPAAGQLDSDAWAVTGWSDGALAFSGTRTTGDFARGAVTAAQTTGGIYAFGTTDRQLMIQPGGGDWAPGTLTLRVINSTALTLTDFTISYELYVRNDQPRSNSFNFSYSTDDSTYISLTSGLFQYTSTAAADPSPTWALVGTPSTTITGLSVAPGGYFYMRWSGNDVSGSGSRDEFGLDDISVSAVPESSAITAFLAGSAVLLGLRRRKR